MVLSLHTHRVATRTPSMEWHREIFLIFDFDLTPISTQHRFRLIIDFNFPILHGLFARSLKDPALVSIV